jgi:RimJ/RimL family protein N-acetyltransferase
MVRHLPLSFGKDFVMTQLNSERLILRNFQLSDAPSVAELIGNWDVAKMLSAVPYPYTLKDAEDFISRFGGDLKGQDTQVFAIQIKQGPTDAVGAIGIHGEKEGPGEAELGYWIGQPYWGQGLVSEAVTAALPYAFQTMGLTQLFAGHFVENDASKRILLKHGFTDFGVRKMPSRSRGCDIDCRQLKLNRETWEQRQ